MTDFDKKLLTVIPVRSGSQGLPNKNIKLFNGVPLLAHAIIRAQESDLVGRVIVSTDSEVYAQIAIEHGAEVPFLRPKELSGAGVRIHHVLKHALEFFDQAGEIFDSVLSIQATAPLVKPSTIDSFIHEYYSSGRRAIGTVSKITSGHPYLAKNMHDDGSLSDYMSLPASLPRYPRQVRPELFFFNGAMFLRNRDLVKQADDFTNAMGVQPGSFLLNEYESINIDSAFDFDLAEIIHKERV